MADFFISYSRSDKEFVRRLNDTLKQHERNTWVDWEGIPPSAEWLNEIYAAIDAAHAFVYVLGPESIKSEVCQKELDHAQQTNKRLIPVVRHDVDVSVVPEVLRRLNWIYFRDTDDFNDAFALLIKALDTDLSYLRSHTRLYALAEEWEQDKDKSLLLTGNDLKQAEDWLVQSGQKDPRPTELHTLFIHTSRSAETRRLQRTLAVMVVAILGIIVLAVLAWYQRNEAVENATRALAGRLAAESRYDVNKRVDLSLLLAAAAVDLEPVGPASGTVFAAILAHPRLDVFLGRLDSSVRNIVFSPDGKVAAVTEDNTLVLFWPSKRRSSMLWSRRIDESQPAIHTLAFSRDGRLLAAAAEDGGVLFWDLQSGERLPTLENPGSSISVLAFSPDSKQLATGSKDGAITLWDIAKRRSLVERPLRVEGQLRAVTFLGGTLHAATRINDALVVWDVMNHRRLDAIPNHGSATSKVIVSGGGSLLARDDAGDAVVLLDLVKQNRLRVPVTIGQGGIASLAVSADLKRLATGGEDGSLILWHVEPRSQLGEWFAKPKEGVKSVAFSQDGKQLAAVTGADKIILWDVESRRELSEIAPAEERGNTKGMIYGVAFGPDKKLLAAIREGDTVTLREPGTSKSPTTPSAEHDGGIHSVAIRADGKLLAVGGRDGKIILWDPVHGKPHGKPLEGRDEPPIRREYGDPAVEQTLITTLAFSPDGKRLLSASGEEGSGDRQVEVTFWDLTSSEPRKARVIEYHETVDGAAFSPSGAMLATAGGGGTVILWDMGSGKRLGEPWAGHQSGTSSMAFSPDGKRLALGTANGIFFGEVDPRIWQQRACSMANRNLTCSEWRESLGKLPYRKICIDLPDPPDAPCASTR